MQTEEEREAEFFETPAWAVWRALEEIPVPWNGTWLDPCVGDGSIPISVGEMFDSALTPHWHCIDKRSTQFVETAKFAHLDNYLQSPVVAQEFDVCIMNPPFSLATAFASRAMTHCTHVVMLQRLNWLATEERAGWMRTHTPDVYVLPNRVSFTKNGKTDSQEYAWFHWRDPCAGPATLKILSSTPKSERVIWEASSTN